jgi:hypothetical protein
VRFHYRHNRLKGFAATGSRDAERGYFPYVFSASGVLGMVSRALNLATVTLLIGCLSAGAAHAQATNLEAGKSPSQIFAGTCNACHKSPRGLLKTVPASSLPGFLRQHYTTSSDMASVLSSYLVSNGATDTRYQAKQEPGKQGKDAKQEPKQEAGKPAGPPDHIDRFGHRQRPAAPAQEAAKPEVEPTAKPDADGLTPQGEGGRAGRNAKRMARPGEAPDAATDSKSGAKQKLSKRGKGGEELPKPEAAKPDIAKEEPASSEPPKEDAVKTETAKTAPAKTDADKADTSKADTSKADTSNKADTSKTDNANTDAAKGGADQPEAAQPASEGRSESAKVDAPRGTGGSEPAPLRPDPVPPVAPAPSTPAAPPAPAASGAAEPAASPSASAPPAAPVPTPVTAVAPPSAPQAAPAGPPEPPISR